MAVPPPWLNDCFLHDKDRLRHDEALALLQERLFPVVGSEQRSLQDVEELLGRIVAGDVEAPHNVPLHTNSAVDGYAFAHGTLGGHSVPVTMRVAAGDLSPEPLEKGTAARIFTGAPMPPGAETVAMQEDCIEVAGMVSIPTALKKGANCRLAGEDLKPGDVVVASGARLRAPDFAALASIGKTDILLRKPLKVTVFSSGNEMRRPAPNEEPLQPGEVFDANTPLLRAMMRDLPIEFTDGGIVRDTAEAVTAAMELACETADAIITTGGASRGEEDHMTATLDKLGKRHLWQLAVKPGRPMMFGQIPRNGMREDCIVFGLPGNPVAAMVCFFLYTRPALLYLAGAGWEHKQRYLLPADFEIKSKPDRREFLRGILQSDGSVAKFARDGSGLISSLREADGLIEIPEDTTGVQRGNLVAFLPF